MQKKLALLKELILEKSFVYNEKEYFCNRIKIDGDVFIIETDSEELVINDVNEFRYSITLKKKQEKAVAVKDKKQSFTTTIIAPSHCEDVSSGLMSMFNKVTSGDVSESELENAKTAVALAGKIIDVEKVKLSYLMLNNK